jgi:hypothetical protein
MTAFTAMTTEALEAADARLRGEIGRLSRAIEALEASGRTDDAAYDEIDRLCDELGPLAVERNEICLELSGRK